MLTLYNMVVRLTRPIAAFLAFYHRNRPELAQLWRQRLGRELPEPASETIWLHGASVGEGRLVRAVSDQIRARFPAQQLALSATSRAGVKQLPADAHRRFLLPIDYPGVPTRLVERLSPRLFTLFETELWPNLIHETAAAGVPIALVNARLAPERISRYRRCRSLYGPLLRSLSFIGAQSEEDAERFESIGARQETINVTGNLKYDLAVPDLNRDQLDRRLGRLNGRALWVAGSTRPGEEQAVLESFSVLRRSFPGLLLVVAPRHLERLEEVRGLIRDAGWEPHDWSQLNGSGAADRDVVLVDTMGDLAGIYGAATLAFVGGSLEPYGGHSPLEPAAAAAPILFGPHTEHYAHPARELVRAGGARQVRDSTELTAAASVWLADTQIRDAAARAAIGVVQCHQGATNRTVDVLVELAGIDSP